MKFISYAISLLALSIAAQAAPVPGASSSPSKPVSNPLQPFASQWGTAGNNYPIIFIHGLLGWGERKPLLGLLNYWGGITTNILDVLRQAGYTAHAPSMGPVSSNWERACEAYAQIKGTNVDYGLARAKKFGHQRFGEDFSGTGFYPAWGTCPTCKVNLVGHSMGGPTQRMLAHLMAYGSAEEMAACQAAGVACSPLFWTNKTSSYIGGVFGIAGVHQGSPFDDMLQSVDAFVTLLLDVIKVFVAVDSAHNANLLYDFQLGHWGLTQDPSEDTATYVKRIFTSPWAGSKSNALFDLSVAAITNPLLSFVKNSQDTTYFSVTGISTFNLLGESFAYPDCLLLLQPTANLIGGYTNNTIGVNGGDWRPNDGLVPLQSARGDVSGYNNYAVNLYASTENVARSGGSSVPAKARYNFVGTLDHTDHLAIVGVLDLIPGQKDQVFKNIAGLLWSLAP